MDAQPPKGQGQDLNRFATLHSLYKDGAIHLRLVQLIKLDEIKETNKATLNATIKPEVDLLQSPTYDDHSHLYLCLCGHFFLFLMLVFLLLVAMRVNEWCLPIVVLVGAVAGAVALQATAAALINLSQMYTSLSNNVDIN